MQKITLLPKGMLQYISLVLFLIFLSLFLLPLSLAAFICCFFLSSFWLEISLKLSAPQARMLPGPQTAECVFCIFFLSVCVRVCVAHGRSSIQAICHGVGCLLGQSR